MALIASTFTFGTSGKGAFSGHLYRISLGFVKKRIYLPPSASAIEAIPSAASYLQRLYLVGQHTQNLVIDEELRAVRQGIVPPPPPVVSAGAGTTQQIGYLRWYDEITGEKSSISGGTSFTGNTTRTWATLPTEVSSEVLVVEGTVNIAAGVVTGVGTATNFGVLRPGDRIAISTDLTRWSQVRTITSDALMTIDDAAMAGAGVILVVKPVSRVSHVEEWISVDGGLPRFGTRLRIGTTGNTESIATLALGEALVNSYEPMPTGSINLIYGDRQLVAGVQGQLHKAFLSEIGFPERYAGLAFLTKYGEPIVGAMRYRDYNILLCPDSSYRLQGYTEDDYQLTVLEPDIGGLGHLGNRIAEGIGYIPGRKSVQTFNGAFHPAMPTRRSEWIDDYRDNAIAFEGGLGVVDSNGQNYMFLPNVQRLAVSSQEAAVLPSEVCEGVAITEPISITSSKLYIVGQGVFFPGGVGSFPLIDAEQGIAYGWFGTDQTPRMRQTQVIGFDPLDPYRNITLDIAVDGGTGTAYTWGYDVSAAFAVNALVLKSFQQGEDPVELARVSLANDPLPASVAVLGGVPFVSYYKLNPFNDAGVYRLSGGALVLDDSQPGVPNPPLLAVLGSDLYAVYGEGGSSANIIRRRVAGVWNSLTMPGPGQWQARTYPTVFNSEMWCFGYDSSDGLKMLKVVGSTVTDERTPGLGSERYIYPTVFDGFLYYVFEDTVDIWIGRFDGATWNDNYKNITAQFGVDLGSEIGLCAFGGSLYLIARNSDPGTYPCQFNLFSSNGTDVAGAWAQEDADHIGFYQVSSGIPTAINTVFQNHWMAVL